jgi:molybdopterin adenylyltransferase
MTATKTTASKMTSKDIDVSVDPAQLLVIGLVSVSDRASGGVYQDLGIPALEEWLARALTTPYRLETRLIADERALIEATLTDLVDIDRCHLVLTTGGTGPARRDVTPEATLAVGTREMPGFGEQMRQISLRFVPTAILSRQTAVIRETPDHAALIMNLPGQPKAIAETLGGLKDADGATLVGGIFAAVPYCVDLIGGPYMETDPAVCKAFRPKSALRPQPAA